MIYVTGDTHGLNDVQKLINNKTLDNLTTRDFLIVTGDFGAVWDNGAHDKAVLDFYSRQTYITLFLDGNHENFDLLNSYPVEEWHNGRIHRITDKVFHLMRGQIYDLENLSIFTFGGGLSIDKEYRIPGYSWWPEEEPSDEECLNALSNLKIRNNLIDIILTHSAPKVLVQNHLAMRHNLIRITSKTESFLNSIMVTVRYRHWYCGHYHFDMDIPSENLSVLYERVVNITSSVEFD